MSNYMFTVLLDRVPNDDEQNLLDDSGLDDGSIIISGNGQSASIMVTREAASLDDAILTVIEDIRSSGFVPVGIANDDIVSLSDIARRLNRTHESVRLLAAGKRGPGGFPAPIASGMYSWNAVRTWCVKHQIATPIIDTELDTLAAADLMLRARLIRPKLGKLAQIAN